MRQRVKTPAGKQVAELRAAMGLTQTEFGQLVYRSLRIVQDWEAGKRQCPADTWEYLQLLHSSPVVRRARAKLLRKRKTL